MPNSFEGPKSVEKFGANVEIMLKIIRHGDRDPKTNMLTEYGEEETRARAKESNLVSSDFDVIHAVGSTVGPYDEEGRGRAEATADIYAGEVAKYVRLSDIFDNSDKLGDRLKGKNDYNTRKTEVVDFTKYKTPPPYDHPKVYNSFLPKNFEELSPEEKAKAGVIAQGKTVEYVLALDSPEAEKFKEEAAGSLAYLIKHYQEVSHRLPSERKAFVPTGIHGPTMEFLMQKALVRKDKDGKEIRGFKDLAEIGGQHNVSEAFTVNIGTDENGQDKTLTITFDNPERPASDKMILDSEIVKELAEKFDQLHPELRGLREKKEE